MFQGHAVLRKPSATSFIFMDAGLSIQQLRNKRKDLATEMRNLLDDNKDYTDEASARVDEIIADIDRTDKKIAASERLLTIEENLDQRGETRAGESGHSVDEEVNNVLQEKSVFNTYLRGGSSALNEEQRNYMATRRQQRIAALIGEGNVGLSDQQLIQALQTGDDAQGGYLTPTDFSGQLLQKMKALGGVRNVCQVLQTSHGRTIEYATVDETTTKGRRLAENAPAVKGDPGFGTTNIGAFKYSSDFIEISIELLADNEVDLEGYINGFLATRLHRIVNEETTTGTGVDMPQGVATASSLGTSAAAVDVDVLIDMEHSVDPAYRLSPNWMFNDKMLRNIKKLKDGQGRHIWLPGMTSADPNTILTYAYEINQDMVDAVSGSKPLLFGDFSKYILRDVLAINLMRFTDSAFAMKGQVAFLAFSRHDGRMIDATNESIRHLLID